MPAKSVAQWKFMQGVKSGSIKQGKNTPTKAQAAEFVQGQSPAGLPRQVEKKRPTKKGKG